MRYALFNALEAEQVALVAAAPPASEAQGILTVAQAAFGDLRGLLLTAPDDLLDREPAPAEWSVRRTLVHTIGVERSYRANTLHGATRREGEPLTLSAEQRPSPDPADTAGDVLAVVAAFARRRAETDAALSSLAPEQLARPSQWSAVEGLIDVDVRFRLHRFASHIAEHAQQCEKTLRSLGHAQTDAHAVVRRISAVRGWHERRSGAGMLARLDAALAERAASLTA